MKSFCKTSHFLRILLLFLLILLSIPFNYLSAQAPAIAWDKTIGGTNRDELYTLVQTSDNGFLLGGRSSSNIGEDKSEDSRGSYDYWIVKIDANGNKLWDKTYGGTTSDILSSIINTSDGGFLLGGRSTSNISPDKSEDSRGSSDYWIIKIDANGNKLWDKTYGGDQGDLLYKILATTDGGYLLCGESQSGISGEKSDPSNDFDFWVVKIDANGNKLWDKTFGADDRERSTTASLASDGGFLLGGFSNSNISGDKSENAKGGYDYWVIKLDSNGNKLWDKTIGGSTQDELYGLASTSDNGFILGGASEANISGDKSENSKGSSDYWIVKIDASGNIQWDKTIGSSGYDFLTNVLQSTDGGFILCGSSSSDISGDKTEDSRGNSDFWVVKTNASGNIQWDKTLGGDSADTPFTLEQATDGGYISGGITRSSASGDKTEDSRGIHDYWVIKLEAENLSVKKSTLSEAVIAYPVPFKDQLFLQYQFNFETDISISIYDIKGSLIKKISNEAYITNKKTTLPIEIKNSESGLYIIKITTNRGTVTKKVTLH